MLCWALVRGGAAWAGLGLGGDASPGTQACFFPFAGAELLVPALCVQVVLCGTGQVYNYPSLRAWLSTGQRKCPKTNLVRRSLLLSF